MNREVMKYCELQSFSFQNLKKKYHTNTGNHTGVCVYKEKKNHQMNEEKELADATGQKWLCSCRKAACVSTGSDRGLYCTALRVGLQQGGKMVGLGIVGLGLGN